MNCIVTAGPTFEPLDQVRRLTNMSTGRLGTELANFLTAQGHTVGLAQRMEALASPDSCYLTAATAALARGYFALEDLGDFRVKGVAEPVSLLPSRAVASAG